MKKARKWKWTVLDILMGLLLLFGIGALCYPFVSDTVNTFLDQQIIDYYQAKANHENEEAMQAAKAKMESQNK